jgi:hypothetical protein
MLVVLQQQGAISADVLLILQLCLPALHTGVIIDDIVLYTWALLGLHGL